MSVVGVDGCRSGWIAVAIHRPRELEACLLAEISELPLRFPDATVVAIDMPIGLATASFRSVDSLARRELGPRGSSVFAIPPRAVLETAEHASATALCVELTGKGVSRQSHGLRHKILEVDSWLPAAPFDVREASPELCFAAMTGHPSEHPKKTWGGVAERIAALQREGLDPLAVAGDGAAKVAPDDLLDALAAAWTAERIEAKTSRSIPDPPEVLDSGNFAAVWI